VAYSLIEVAGSEEQIISPVKDSSLFSRALARSFRRHRRVLIFNFAFLFDPPWSYASGVEIKKE
jgi:hypothetical protein